MKRCFKCGQDKERDAFYKHPQMGDGLLGKCKECTKKDATATRIAKIEYYRSYDRMRASMPHRVMARIEYQSTDAGRAAVQRGKNSYLKRNPQKRAAHIAIRNAIKSGKVVPWPVCAVPECNGKPEAHHPDYSAPLDVVWLCKRHHEDTHMLYREIQRAA